MQLSTGECSCWALTVCVCVCVCFLTVFVFLCVGPSNQSRHHLEYRAIMQEMSPTAFGMSHTSKHTNACTHTHTYTQKHLILSGNLHDGAPKEKVESEPQSALCSVLNTPASQLGVRTHLLLTNTHSAAVVQLLAAFCCLQSNFSLSQQEAEVCLWKRLFEVCILWKYTLGFRFTHSSLSLCASVEQRPTALWLLRADLFGFISFTVGCSTNKDPFHWHTPAQVSITSLFFPLPVCADSCWSPVQLWWARVSLPHTETKWRRVVWRVAVVRRTDWGWPHSSPRAPSATLFLSFSLCSCPSTAFTLWRADVSQTSWQRSGILKRKEPRKSAA